MRDTFESMEKSGYLKEEFRLFHIKDKSDREFQYHYHDFHKIIIFLSGEVTYHIEGKAYHLQPWDILLVNRFAIHKPEISSSVPYERFILWIQDNLQEPVLNACFEKARERSFNLIRLNPRFQERLKDILYELETSRNTSAFCSDLLADSLFRQFLIYVNRIFLEKSYIHDHHSYTFDSRIEALVRYINDHLDSDLTLETLAQKYYLSKYHMMRKFKEETGYTMHNYINSKRLLLSRSLIEDGVPVMKAAIQSGFHDYTTFVKAYKKQFGSAPTKL